jgi:hypothetical protein
MLMYPGGGLSEAERSRLARVILLPDFERHASYGCLNLLAAYWRLRREGLELPETF